MTSKGIGLFGVASAIAAAGARAATMEPLPPRRRRPSRADKPPKTDEERLARCEHRTGKGAETRRQRMARKRRRGWA